MRNVVTIARKELQAYFASPIAYVVIGFFAFVFGWMYASILGWFVSQGMQAGLGMGERLLIHGAAGGVGTAAVQLGRAAGARVTATVRDAQLRERVAALGAEAIAPEGFAEHGPFDVVLELVGATNLADDLGALATGGRIAVIGVGAGAVTEINLLALMGKRARIHGSTLRARSLEDKAAAARALERHVLPLLADGTVGVPVAATFPLAEVHEAYERFAAGGKLGKVVLTLD